MVLSTFSNICFENKTPGSASQLLAHHTCDTYFDFPTLTPIPFQRPAQTNATKQHRSVDKLCSALVWHSLSHGNTVYAFPQAHTVTNNIRSLLCRIVAFPLDSVASQMLTEIHRKFCQRITQRTVRPFDDEDIVMQFFLTAFANVHFLGVNTAARTHPSSIDTWEHAV